MGSAACSLASRYASELLHAQTGVSGVFAGIQVAVTKCTECVDAITKDNGSIGINHTCIILGDVLDIEAVSTMRIVALALTDMGERALVSADTPTEVPAGCRTAENRFL